MGLLQKLKSYGISSWAFGLCLSFTVRLHSSSFVRLSQMVLDVKSSQCPVNTCIPQGSVLGTTHFLQYINDLPNVICNIAIYADNATVYS